MATPEMETRTNRRGFKEHFVGKHHLKLEKLREKAESLTKEEKRYVHKVEIPAYPQPEFHVTRLKHDTNLDGLTGIREKGGFTNPHGGSLLWFSLDVGPEEIKEAESRPVETFYPDRTGEKIQIQNQQIFLEKFASSPVFQRSSMFGSYRFTFSVEEVLDAYKHQFCGGRDPVMKVMETVLFKQEVTYVVLIHSPTAWRRYSNFPRLSDNPDPVCSFEEEEKYFIWRSEAMCETHRYKLVQNDAEKKIQVVKNEVPQKNQRFVWDHVAVALHVGEKTLEFDVDELRKKLTFCEKEEFKGNSHISFEDFETAERKVQELWPDHPKPLMRDGEKPEDSEEEEDDLSEDFDKLKLQKKVKRSK